MLTQLTINNFAIVRHLVLELNEGMSVITGETGAGKSIAIDALGLCLGYRSESSMIRQGAEKAEITATFYMQTDSPAYLWLKTRELLDSDNPNECILRRMINLEGRSKAFVNGSPIPVSQLRELGEYLIHLNGQHAPQLLLKTDYQLEVLDNFAELTASQQKMAEVYSRWRKVHQQVLAMKQKREENDARKQLLEYQVQELDEFALKAGEFAEMEEEQSRLSNAEQLLLLSQTAVESLSESGESSVDAQLFRVLRHLEELEEMDSRYGEAKTMLNEALIQVQESVSLIQLCAGSIEQDPHALNELDQRIAQALQLARKHGVSVEELPQHHQQLKAELQKLTHLEENEADFIHQEMEAKQACLAQAEALYQQRLDAAKKLAVLVTEQIKLLSMENSEFYISVDHNPKRMSANGADAVEFYLRTNLGQQAQSLAKIVSGGELSRISLAVQVLTANKRSTPTIIFDEVDVGISGPTATVVGKLLRQLGKKCQVICVTHLPQVASYGHHHFNVQKYVHNEQTETQMTKLDENARIDALARLLGGSKITETVRANAVEMLKLVEE